MNRSSHRRAGERRSLHSSPAAAPNASPDDSRRIRRSACRALLAEAEHRLGRAEAGEGEFADCSEQKLFRERA
jgi:hypothetical protein